MPYTRHTSRVPNICTRVRRLVWYPSYTPPGTQLKPFYLQQYGVSLSLDRGVTDRR